MNGWLERMMDKKEDGWMEWMDGNDGVDRWMSRWMSRWMDRWMDG